MAPTQEDFTNPTLINLSIKFFILIAIGYGLRKGGAISERLEKDLGSLLIRVILPFSIIGSANTSFDRQLSKNLALAGAFALSYYIIAILSLIALSRTMKTDEKTKKIFVNLGTFANVGFLGLPITQEIFGQIGLLYTIVYNLVFQFVFLVFGEMYVSGKKKDNIVKTIVTDPGILASLSAILLFMSPVKLPKVVADSFLILGSMMTPISLLIIGCRMTTVPITEFFTDRLSWLISFIRLVFFPAVFYFLAKPFGLAPELIAVMIMITGLPSGAMNVIIANEHDCNPAFASKAVALSTFLMLFTLPVLISAVS